MTTGRGAGALLITVTIALATGCSAGPPTAALDGLEFAPAPAADTATTDIAAATELLWATLPTSADLADHDVREGEGLDYQLTIDGSLDDHDAHQLAGVYRVYTSPGWIAGYGAMYWFSLDVLLMDSAHAADAFLHEVSLGAVDGYTLTPDNGTTEEYSATVIPHRDYLPEGSIERSVVTTWDDGWYSNGWIAWMAVGETVAVASFSWAPDDTSAAAAASVAETHIGAFVERLEGLPEQIGELR